jgi:hypothetical protein
MKMKSAKLLTIIASASLLVSSCKKFDDTNVNPNGTSTPSTAALLTNVESGLGGFATQTQGGLYAQYFSETQYTDVSLYALPKGDFDGTYSGSLYDLQNIILYNTDPEKVPLAAKFGSANNQIAIARILKAYIYWTLTDRWGDIPYFDALKGKEELTPKFDTQESIYKDLVKELTEAADQFDAGAKPVGDFLFAGDAASWKRVANSLRMLITLRTSKVYPNPGDWAATEFAKAYADADGYIDDNSKNLTLKYPGTAAFRNPWYNLYNGRSDYAESQVITNLTSSTGDARQSAFGTSTVGFPYGLTRDAAVAFGNANTNYAKVMSSTFQGAAAAVTPIAASHVLLAIAEASQRGWITANTTAVYEAGITASWNQWSAATGNLPTYLASSAVSLAAGTPLQKIQLQQYIAYYPDGLQGWSNWRRTNVPALTPTPNATNSSKQIPRRYTYGSLSYSVNTDNTNEAVGRLTGGDTPDARVWWDKP